MAQDLSINVTQPDSTERISALVNEIASMILTPFSVEFGEDAGGRYAKIRAETNEEHGAREPEEKRFVSFTGLTKTEIAHEIIDDLGDDPTKDGTEERPSWYQFNEDEAALMIDFIVRNMTDEMAQDYVDAQHEALADGVENGDDWYYDVMTEINEKLEAKLGFTDDPDARTTS